MDSTKTSAQTKANYVRLMGPQAGEAFAELMQDAAHLHLRWNEFLALFAVNSARIDTLNKAAPGFFYLVSDAWWDGLILHIFRMTDCNKKVLSLVSLSKLLPTAVRSDDEPKLKLAVAASRFAHDLRHANIGHRNREVALKVKPVPRSSRDQIRKAIAAIDEALHFVDYHYTGHEAAIYDHLDIGGGAGAILWIVERGLRARGRRLHRASSADAVHRLGWFGFARHERQSSPESDDFSQQVSFVAGAQQLVARCTNLDLTPPPRRTKDDGPGALRICDRQGLARSGFPRDNAWAGRDATSATSTRRNSGGDPCPLLHAARCRRACSPPRK